MGATGLFPPAGARLYRVGELTRELKDLIEGKLGTRSLVDALDEEHVPKAQIFRILKGPLWLQTHPCLHGSKVCSVQ